jgi:hypothetical protein
MIFLRFLVTYQSSTQHAAIKKLPEVWFKNGLLNIWRKKMYLLMCMKFSSTAQSKGKEI